MTIIYFILILGITVLVHEFGHFIFAKKYGVYVYEFSIGMGPRLFKFNRKNDETDYCIRLLPIGGYVQMAGEEVEVDEKIPENQRLQSKPIFQRFMIMVAGVMNNFIFSIIVLFFIGLFNTVSTNNVYIADSTIKGLEDGTKIIKINNRMVNNYDKLALELTIANGKTFTVTTVDKNNKKKDVKINPISMGKENLIYGYDYGFTVNELVVSTSKNDLIKKNSKIVKVNDIKINNYLELLDTLESVKGEEINITFNKNDKEYDVDITPKEYKDELTGYSLGFHITGKQSKGFISALKYAFLKFFSIIEQMIFTVLYLITGDISLSMMSGPVGIFNIVSVYSSYGFTSILSLLCLICVNVGFINILPLPAFDGGHILFLLIEKIKGSKVNPKVENTIHNIGFVLLMILMVIITYGDIVKLFR